MCYFIGKIVAKKKTEVDDGLVDGKERADSHLKQRNNNYEKKLHLN